MKKCMVKDCTRAVDGDAKYCSFHRSAFGRAKQKQIQRAVRNKVKREGQTA